MPNKAMSVHEAAAIAKKIADEMGYEFIDAELVKEPTGRMLRFYVDKGDGVSLDELEIYHKRIQPLMEDVDYDYMEVSSPGADRPLKTEGDFVRAEGVEVEVKTYRNVNGAKRFIGTLVGLREGSVVITMPDGSEMAFPMKDVALVKPYIDIDENDLM